MIKNFLRKIGKPTSLTRHSRFNFHNEVPKFDPSKDYYNILEVTKDSSDSELKKSYYRLAKMYHPDSNPGKQGKFKEINEAYSVLSDDKLKRQYNSARSFQGFSRRMRSKASEGTYNYQDYRGMYENLSPEEQEQIVQQFKARVRKVMLFGLVMIVIIPFLTRRNHEFYVLQDGELIPVQFEGGMRGGMMPPPGAMGPYGAAPYPTQYPNQPNVGPYRSNAPPGQYQPYYGHQPSNPYEDVVRNMPPQYRQQPNYGPQ